MKKVLVKQKRHRRTKAEMKAYRDSQYFNTGEGKGKDKKSSEKPNLEAEQPILEHIIAKISCISKPKVEPKQIEQVESRLIEGWVNVYKDGESRYESGCSYWLGSDIHPTKEAAAKVTGDRKAHQVQITFEGF